MLDHLRRKKLLGASQDGNHEFISLLACICADGTALSPGLIYQDNSGDMQDTWLENFDHSSDEAYFATSSKDWTSEDLDMSWLETIFNYYIKEKTGNSCYLLIINDFLSHVNLQFINYCDLNQILLIILPPHSTY